MKTSSFAIVCLVAILGAGCDTILGSDDGRVELDTEAEYYTPGDTVTARLTNRTDHTITTGFCYPELERRAENGWVPARSDAFYLCPLVLQKLDPGESVQGSVILPDSSTYGEYRATGRYDRHGKSAKVHSPSFQVGPRVFAPD